MLFTVSLATKLKEKGVIAFSLHPGIVFTNLIRHMPEDELRALGESEKLTSLA